MKTELDSTAKAKLILDPSAPGLSASQMVIYVEGSNEVCHHFEPDDDGDDVGPASVHIGAENIVQSNIYAANAKALAERQSLTALRPERREAQGAYE